MPLYEYACWDCKEGVEAFQKMADAPLDTCPHCRSKNFARVPTLPNGKVRACMSSEELGLVLPSDEERARQREEKDRKLPWWRNGTVEGLPKKDKPVDITKIKDMSKYIEKGEMG